MSPDNSPDRSANQSAHRPLFDGPARLYPLLADPGNQRMLVEWIEGRDGYTAVDPEQPIEEAMFDICILDAERFRADTEQLETKKRASEPIQLPYLLLLSDRDQQLLNDDRRELVDNVVWRTIDEIIELPLKQQELYWRIESLLRIRRQSMQLANSEGRYRSMVEDAFNSVDVGLLVFDADQAVTWVNDALVESFDLDRTEIMSMDAETMLTDCLADRLQLADRFLTRYRQSFADNEPLSLPECSLAGTERWFAGRSDPITVGTLAGGRIHQYWEITEQKESEQQLSVVDRVLRHNLRNELTVIQGNAEDIRSQTTGEVQDAAHQIIADSNALLSTAEKSRDITELLMRDPPPRQMAISPLIDHAVATVTNRHPSVEVTKTVNEPGKASAVPELERALEELLTNGIVHNESTSPQLAIETQRTDTAVTITVTDNGPGIPEVDRNVLEHGEQKDELYHGSGLGMWLVHLTVRKAGGQVRADSDSAGTTVRITLPTELPVARN